MELSKIYSSGALFFNRVIITPKVSDVFIKGISAIGNNGEVSSLSYEPIELNREIVLSNNLKNSIALEVIIDHPSGTEIDDLIYVNISRIKLQDYGTVKTNKVRIRNKGSLYLVSDVRNDSGAIISSTVYISGVSKDGETLFSDKLKIGIGHTREILSTESIYGGGNYRYYKDGIISKDVIPLVDNKIKSPDPNSYYIYEPSYLKAGDTISISSDISLDKNNRIIIKNKDVDVLECSIDAEILNTNMSDIIIKYIGVMSR